MEQQPEKGTVSVSKDTLWYLDNYILLKDYFDRTVSRIAARCVRKGNIAMEEYPFYGYILDVLEEISETGEYVLDHPELYPYIEKKIPGGVEAMKKNLKEYQEELQNNSSPDMIKQDSKELDKMKAALGDFEKGDDPTAGAGMNMDQLIDKLMNENNIKKEKFEDEALGQRQIPPQNTNRMQQPRPAAAPSQAGRPQPSGSGQARPATPQQPSPQAPQAPQAQSPAQAPAASPSNPTPKPTSSDE